MNKNISINDLANFLKEGYNNPGERGKVAAVHNFGVKYGKHCKKDEISIYPQK
ncbi:MAG: hypothetical protein LBK53_09520 [Heliobacteriaceae bacterium]|jgi:hypothetical protein|nr:hypothetical protein [Heliobacteriaceae bacterium]